MRANEPYTPPRPEQPRRAAGPPVDGRHERPLGDLFRELGNETKTLVRQEIQLAKTEATEKAKRAGKHAGILAGGGFVAYAGFIAVVIAFGLLLGTFMPDWLGLTIAGAIVVAAGLAMVKKGMDGIRNTDFALERTAHTFQEDKQWMKHEAQEVKDDPRHLGAGR